MARANVRTVGESLRLAVDRWPERTALRSDAGDVTFSEVGEQVGGYMAGLRALGLEQGDRLLLMLPNVADYVYLFLAAATRGLVEVPINTDYRGEMLRHIVQHSKAEAIILAPEYLARLQAIDHGGLPTDRVYTVGPEEVAGYRRFVPGTIPLALSDAPAVLETDPVAVMYTSGTTGPSKGGLIAHRHAYEYANAVTELVELSSDDVYYAPLPLFHIGGQWAVLYASVIRGATFVLKERFSVGEFWDDVAANGATVSFLLGAMAQWLNGQPRQPDDAARPLDRVLMVPLIDQVADFSERFQARVATCYGSTESNVPIRAGFDISVRGSCGRVAPGYEVRLVDEFDEEVEVGQVGEVAVRTSEPYRTMIEYHADPAVTARALRNMWLHTGDLMRRDENGNLFFVDRLSDSLRRRGENISSFEVERDVYTHEAVLECAAIAAPSANTEDDLVVVVVPRPGVEISAEELKAFLSERMPRFMVPDRIVLVGELPKTPTGKIQKHKLRESMTQR